MNKIKIITGIFVSWFSLQAQAGITGPTSVCAGSTQVYSAVLDPGLTVDRWLVVGGTISGANNSVNVTIIWSSSGSEGTLTLRKKSVNKDTFLEDVTITFYTGGTAASSMSSVCPGNSTTLLVNGNHTIISYWQVSTNGGGTWSNIPSSGTDPYVYTNITSASMFRAVSTNCATMLTSSAVSVSVLAPTGGGTLTGGTGFCGSYSGTITLTNYDSEIISKWWKKVGAGSWEVWNVPTKDNATQSVNISTTTYYRVETSGNCGNQFSNEIVFTQNPIPDATASGQSICSGTSTSISITNPNGIPGTTFNWTVSSNNVSGASAGSGSSITQTLTNSTASNGTVTYAIKPSAPSGCTGTTVYAVATVKPIPGVSAASQTLCSGQTSSINITESNGVSGTTFSWTASSTNVSGASGGSGSSIAQTLTATTNVSGIASYTITPTASGCIGSPANVNATVKPVPTASASGQTLCSGQASSISLSNPNNVPGTTFSWTVSNTNVSGSSSGSGPSIAQTLTATTNSSGTADYTITPAADGCAGSSVNASVTVKPVPTVSASGQTLCSGQATSISISNPNNIPGTTFSWTVSNTNVSGSSNGNGSGIAQTLMATTNVSGTAVYSITATADGCASSALNATAIVKPLPQVSVENHFIFSSQSTGIPVNNINSVSGVTYSWTAAESNVTGGTSGSGTLINTGTLLNGSTSTGTATYAITPVAGSCSGSSVESIVTVYPLPVLSATRNIIVKGDTVVLSTTEGYATYLWKKESATLSSTTHQLTTNETGSYTVTVTKNGATGTSKVFLVASQLAGMNRNYIVTETVQIKNIFDSEEARALPVESVLQEIKYFDGLGRPIQIVLTQGSSDKKDIVMPIAYDQFGREHRKYLPYASGDNGWFKQDFIPSDHEGYGTLISPHYQFYQNSTNIAVDGSPFSKIVFENSPLNRPEKEFGPGSAWHNNNKFVQFDYKTNVHGTSAGQEKIVAWIISESGMPIRSGAISSCINSDGHYLTGQLILKVTKDEHGNAVREYATKEGRIVLKKVQVNTESTDINNTADWALTYYVYDIRGNLRFVMPPELSKNVIVNNPSQTNLNNWAFQYKYDERNLMVSKQVPGAEPVYIVYDKRDRVVLTQDGNQRVSTPKYWSFTKYDELNRPILTGIKDTAVTLTQAEMQTVVNAHYNKAWAKYGEIYIGNSTGNTHGYTNKSYPATTRGDIVNEEDYLSVTYYDDYSIRTKWIGDYDYINDSLTLNLNGIPYTQPALEFNKVNGLVTATKIKVLDDGIRGGYTWLKTINYYDDKYRPIQSISDNYKGGLDRVSNLFDFTGKVLQTKNVHTQYDVNWKNFLNAKAVGNKLQRTTAANGLNNSGAVSKEILAEGADGWFEFTVSEANILRAVGLAVPNSEVGLASITYAFYLNTNATLTVYESGVSKGNVAGGYKTGDKLKIERVGTNIRYYRNNVLIYTSLQPSSTSLIIDAALNSGNASIVNSRASFSSGNQTIVKRFEYDHIGRLLRTYHKVNDEDEVLLSENKYNELGQLVTKKLHNTDNDTTFKQHVDYRYNIRGWMTRINNSNLEPDDVNEPKDYFGMELAYNNDIGIGTTTPQFNGNISAMKWSTNQGLGFNDEELEIFEPTQRAYTFTYDPMNRLKVAAHAEKTTGWNATQAYREEIQQYDLNSNIKNLVRKGKNGNTIDMLTYNYGTSTTASNRLLYVTDAADRTQGFKEMNSVNTTDYTYDKNGNLTWDRNKGGMELLTNGSFENGSADWAVTDAVSRLTFTNNEVQITTGSAEAELMQSTLVKGKPYVVVLDIERTAGTLTLYLGGVAKTTISTTGTNVYSITASSTNTEFKITADAAFAGKIKSVSVKGVTVITYNYLNLPELVTKAGDQQLQFIYDATGRKLAQELSKNGIIEKRTDYAGEFIYENDTLKFINHEEGRIVLEADSSYTYDYTLRDHLGNTRITFTTKPKTETFTATLEDDTFEEEQSNFNNYQRLTNDLLDHTDAGTTYDKALVLNGGYNGQVGLAKSFAVVPGDIVRAKVYAKYLSGTGGTGNLANFALALTGAFGLNSTMTGEAGTMYETLNSFGSIIAGNGRDDEESAPKGFINILVFNKEFELVDFAYQQIDASYVQSGPTKAPHQLLSVESAIRHAGYAYVFLSNENATEVQIGFDDFAVLHIHSAIIQQDDYYPFGLTFNSYKRENSTENRYLYNQGTGEKTFNTERITDLGLNIDMSRDRTYDPALGRWWQVDPKADEAGQEILSPYQYAFNNPVLYNDPYGDCPRCPTPRYRYQATQNYRNIVRRQQITTSYRNQNGVVMNQNGPRESVTVGTANNPQTTQGQIIRGAIRLSSQYKKFSDQVKEARLDVSASKVETVNTNGFGDAKSEGSKYVFSGPDAVKLEVMENVYQGQVNAEVDKRFSAFASEKLGTDYNSLSPGAKAEFDMANGSTAGLMRSVVQTEIGPSPKQQVIAQQQELLQQGVLAVVVEKKDLPVIRQGN